MAETIIIKGKSASLTTSRGAEHRVELQKFCEAISNSTIQGFDNEPNPDNVVWNVRCGPLRICIAELKPQLHSSIGCIPTVQSRSVPGRSPANGSWRRPT